MIIRYPVVFITLFPSISIPASQKTTRNTAEQVAVRKNVHHGEPLGISVKDECGVNVRRDIEDLDLY